MLDFDSGAKILSDFGLDLAEIPHGELLFNELKTRAKTLVEFVQSAQRVLNRPQNYDEKSYAKFVNEQNLALLAKFGEILARNYNARECEEITMKFLEENGAKLKDLAAILRLAITGTNVSPSIFEMIEILGVAEVKARISNLK